MTDRPPLPRRKRIRLAPALYTNPDLVCSITICSARRDPCFGDLSLGRTIVDLLVEQAEASHVKLYAYCLMPDHLHLMVRPDAGASLVAFVQAFKSRSTRLAWEHGCQGAIWQRRFYDHFLRRDEDLRRAAEYIVYNPVRAGLVREWREYPLSGLASDLW